jgi:putative addiction module killer protein
MVVKRLIDYETPSGKFPIREWLSGLDTPIIARIEARLKRVALGNMGDVKSVGEGVSELRMTFGSGYRVYFGQYEGHIIILLCGGDKGTQDNDIETAKKYWLDFNGRNNEFTRK